MLQSSRLTRLNGLAYFKNVAFSSSCKWALKVKWATSFFARRSKAGKIIPQTSGFFSLGTRESWCSYCLLLSQRRYSPLRDGILCNKVGNHLICSLDIVFKGPSSASFNLFSIFSNKQYKYACGKMSIKYPVLGFEFMTSWTLVFSHNH